MKYKNIEALRQLQLMITEAILRCSTNNWKKIHGYPMKRNNGKRKL